MALRTYPGRLLAASVTAGLFALAVSGSVAGYLYHDQTRTADALAEDIDSRGAAIELEATVNNLIVLHAAGSAATGPLVGRAAEDIERIESYADKPPERELLARIRASFERYERRRDGGTPRELAEVLRLDALPAVQALRTFNGGELRASQGDHRRALRRMAWGLAVVGGLGSAAGIVVGYGLARGLQRSIQRFLVNVQGASELLGKQLPAVELVGGGDPLDAGGADLLRRVEQVVSRLNEREREARRAERLAAVGQLAAGVAHEIRNPLTSAILLLEIARKDPAAGGLTDEDLLLIEGELHRIEGTLQTFLLYARPPKLDPVECDLREVVRDALALTRARLERAGIRADVTAPADLPALKLDRGQMRQVLLNLILNAVDAMPAGGRLAIGVTADATGVELTVRDTGTGIPAAIGPRLFEPFATGKETGTGLGLVMCRRIVEDHRGTIRGGNCPGGGAAFTVHLPWSPP